MKNNKKLYINMALNLKVPCLSIFTLVHKIKIKQI